MQINGKNLCVNCFSEKMVDHLCQNCGYIEGNVEISSLLPPGTVLLGKYMIGRVLGKGGFGVTYLAYDIKNDKRVVIKEYMPDTLAYRTPGTTIITSYGGEKEENFKTGSEKFYEEAKILSQFNENRNIISIEEFFYENNTAYFVMEYLEGVDLRTYVKQKGGKLSQEECLDLFIPIMNVLTEVHNAGVLHRDISPDNIYISTEGIVKLLDFGAARQVLNEQSKSLSVLMKPGFTPVEQYQRRGKQGRWSDVYAMGATMYYCLTGVVPESSMDRVYEDSNKKVSEWNNELSNSLDNVLIKALAVRIDDRYQTMEEFRNELIKLKENAKVISAENSTIKNEENNLYAKMAKKETALKKLINFGKYAIPILSSVIIIAIVFVVISVSKKDDHSVSILNNPTLDKNEKGIFESTGNSASLEYTIIADEIQTDAQENAISDATQETTVNIVSENNSKSSAGLNVNNAGQNNVVNSEVKNNENNVTDTPAVVPVEETVTAANVYNKDPALNNNTSMDICVTPKHMEWVDGNLTVNIRIYNNSNLAYNISKIEFYVYDRKLDDVNDPQHYYAKGEFCYDDNCIYVTNNSYVDRTLTFQGNQVINAKGDLTCLWWHSQAWLFK